MKKTTRHLLGFLTVITLGLLPAVSPVGSPLLGSSQAAPAGYSEVAAGQDCAQFVNDTTGVVVSQVGDDCVVSFTKTGTTDWSYPVGVSTLQVLAVGGGAGGSADGGSGGGGGETRFTSSYPVNLAPETTVRVVVGAGGAPASSGSATTVDFGADNSAEFRANPGAPGGGWQSSTFGTGGTNGAGGTGYSGGNGGLGPQTNSAFLAGATGGAGSLGISIRGQTEYFGGGGGGGSSSSTSSNGTITSVNGAAGGQGGGGAGSYVRSNGTTVSISYDVYDEGTEPTASLVANCGTQAAGNASGATMGFPGLANFGGGGGGGVAYGDNPTCNAGSSDDGERTAGGSGGSGVVIVRYSLIPDDPSGLSLSSGDGQFTVSYSMPTHTGGSTGSLEYTTNGGTNWRDLGETDGSTVVTLQSNGSALVNGTVYSVQLRAKNAENYLSSAVPAGTVMPSPVGEVFRLDATHPDSFETGDTVWTDSTGGLNGTPQGSPVFEPRSKSFTMDGANDWFDLPDLEVDFSEGFALHYVVDFGDAQDFERIIDFSISGTNSGSVQLARNGTTNAIYFEVRTLDGSGGPSCISGSDAIQPGYHAYSVVVTDQGVCTHYRNGVAQGSSTTNLGLLPPPAVREAVFIGKYQSGSQWFDGSIQSVILYNTAQTLPTCFPKETTYPGDGEVGESSVPYTLLSFTTGGACNWSVPTGVTSIDALVVAGGGGGGSHVGSGGGAGGVVEISASSVVSGVGGYESLENVTDLDITVGLGGAGGHLFNPSCSNPTAGITGVERASGLCDDPTKQRQATNGLDSSIEGFTSAIGGGSGGHYNYYYPRTGGSGGGGSFTGIGPAAGTTGQGTSGGAYGSGLFTGGGGGWFSPGLAGTGNSTGNGGAGDSSSLLSSAHAETLGIGEISGQSVFFAGGGGGGLHDSGTSSQGGLGGGGDGNTSPAQTAQDGLANAGGGGGGSGGSNAGVSRGGNGGSGVVLIRYSTAPGAPSIASVSSGNESLTVSLTASSHTAGTTTTGYNFEYSTDANFTNPQTVDSATTSATITGLTNGTTYYVRARANIVGPAFGEWSQSSTGVPVSAIDYYLDFNGTNTRASGDSADLPDSQYTIEAWVIDENQTVGNHAIFRHGDSLTNAVALFTSKQASSNQLFVRVEGRTVNTEFTLQQNRWTHVALTMASNTLRLYVDGQLVWQDTVADPATSGDLLNIGRFNDNSESSNAASGGRWWGAIDQVKLWNQGLTQQQIQTSMHTHSDSGITGPTLLAHYDFNDQSTTDLRDVAGSFDLTVGVDGPTSGTFGGPILASAHQDVATEQTVSGVRTITVPRSYLNALGGYRVASGVSDLRVLAVGGGGGGGIDSGSGGGGGARIEGDVALGDQDSPIVRIVVGQGGIGGSWSSASAGGVRLWASAGQPSSATFIDSSAGELAFSAAAGKGGSQNDRTQELTNSGANDGAGASQPSPATDTSSPISVSNELRVAGGSGGAATPDGYGSRGVGGNGAGGGTSSAFGASYGGGGGGGTSGSNSPGGSGVNGGGNGASTALFATPGATNRGGGGGAGSAYGDNAPRFPNLRDGFDGGSGVVALRYEVVAPPTITTQPTDSSILAGNTATFAVVSSTVGATYQWQVSTNGGGTWSDVDGATNATLSLTSVAVASDGYQYRVVVSSTVNGETATTTSDVAALSVQDGVTVTGAFCDGTYTKNGITIDAGHGEVFYIDTGQGQEIDAGYVAYIVQSASARSDLWVEITDFTGGVVSLANPDASSLPLGSISAGGTDTAFFMIKATGASTTAQSHVVNVYSQKPSIGSPTPIYTCGYSFIEVAETIKAAANKVESITSTSVSKIGSTMTITVQGDTGTIGQGNDIDGRMIWLTPAARSDWPTDALRLESTSISFFSDRNRRTQLTTHADTLRVNATTTPALSGTNRQYYTATYTFRIIGPAASVAPIIPIAMISSGTQIKHTDVGALPTGGTATVDLRSATVDLTVTKDVSPTTSVNDDGTTTLSYDVTLTNGGADALVIDEVVDTPDSGLTFVTGSATFAGASIPDPGATGTASLAFSGPMTIPGNSTRVIAYQMTFPTCSVGTSYTFDNVATAKTGTVIIGSGSATQSTVNIAGNCGVEEAVVTVTDEPIDPAVTTGGASSVTETTATITGTVDPNSQSGLGVRFRYQASDSTLASATTVNLSNTTFADSAYGVTSALTGLSGGTTYYYVLEVEDPDGGWISGTIKSFTTVPAAAPPQAVTLTQTNLSTTSATLNGTVDPNLVTDGAKVRFDWAIDGGSTCANLGPVSNSGFLTSESASGGTEHALLTGSSPTPMAYSLTGLTTATNYCYRIVALSGTSYSTEQPGSWVRFTTGNVTPQTISWGTAAQPLPAGGTTTVSATATSGLAVTYTSVDTSVCTVDSSGVVTAVADSGTCTITASQAGDSTYSAATPRSISFPISPPVVTPATLISGTFQTSGYTQTLRATGGDGTYSSWAVSSGSLPDGLSLDASTGVISGTPTAAGTYTFRVTVTSNGKTSASQEFTITIAKKVVTVSASSPSVVFGAAAPTISPTYSGFVGSDVTTVGTDPNSAPVCTSTYVVGQNAGTTAVSSCRSGFHQNYSYSYINGTVTVTKFPVTITAIDAAKQNIDGTPVEVLPDPTLRWSATSPLPAGQSMSDVVPLGVSTTRATTAEAGTGSSDPAVNSSWPTGEAPGDYVISLSGVAGSNYEVTYVPGTFTIQTPKQVPSLAVSNKTMTYGESNTASTFIGGAATNRANGSVDGTFAYSYLDSSNQATALTDLSTLDAGTYLVSVTFTPTDQNAYYHDANAPLTETMVLTIERKEITVTAADKKKLVGALDPELTWSGTGYLTGDSDQTLGPITISRAPGELAASYAITTTGGDTPNYRVTHVPGSFYIYEPVITVTQSRGVLTSRTVQADCRGAKPGAQATFILETGGVQRNLGTATVANDGTCPITATLDDTVGQGVHRLIVESTDPLDAAMSKQQTIILLASRIQVIQDNPGGGNTSSPRNRGPVVTPLTPTGPALPAPGAIPRPVVPPGSVGNQPVVPQAPQVAPVPNAQTPVLPRVPGLSGTGTPGLPGGTIDFGDGVQQRGENASAADGNTPGSTAGQGRRTIGELASERLGGFQPGVSTRIEILGARSGARFVVSDTVQIDAFTVIRAIQNSIPTQAADFFALQDVRQSAVAPVAPAPWTVTEREAIGEFFEAAGLPRPVSLADIDTSQFTQWVQVTGSASTYQPGSVVYLTLTSDPLVLSSAVVSEDGTAVLSGSLPVEWLGAGEHRVRLVGVRALDGVSVDDQGEIQLSSELMAEIQRFDLGTQSTVVVSGSNPDGGEHVALRVVPLIPTAPWWTLWFILLGFLLVGATRYAGVLPTASRRLVGSVVVLLSATPAVILGWLSTVTAVTWWGLGLGLIASLLAGFVPQRASRRES